VPVALEIDILSATQSGSVALEGSRATVGAAGENDIPLSDDNAVSHLHAVLECFAAGWCISDLGSSNGTWVNGERIWSARRLRTGDEIQIGHTRLLVRQAEPAVETRTEVESAPPAVTPRERDVLLALCRPLLARDMFTEPASTQTVADELVVTQAAVKQHLSNLYEKFEISADEANRRLRLANDALRRGVVSINDLQQNGSE
jgi:pSer/pThr/pTyr-binding forkhead associated (FHA) protein